MATAATVLCAAGPAHGAFFAADTIDGPSDEIVAVGGVDLAPDGGGTIVHLRRWGTDTRVFAAALAGGRWGAPRQVDGALSGSSTAPVVSTADDGRAAIAFVNGGRLYVTTRAPGADWFSEPVAIAAAGDAVTPAIDMSVHGVVHVVFTTKDGTGGADVRAAVNAGDGWRLHDPPLDVSPGAVAGDAEGRPQVAVSADGTALAVWGESGTVQARRISKRAPSGFAVRASLDTLEGRAGESADLPAVGLQHDSSYGWVVMRQRFAGSGSKVIARQLVGSAFEAPIALAADRPVLGLNGRGFGAAAGIADGGVQMAALSERRATGQVTFPPAGGASALVSAFGEGDGGLVVWQSGPGLGARAVDKAEVLFDGELSAPALGPVDGAAGLVAAADRTDDVIVGFVQGEGSGRRLMAGGYDRPPLLFVGRTSRSWTRRNRLTLRWSPSTDLWGAVTYRGEIDGVAVGTTAALELPLAAPVADGAHTWRAVAIDARGQETGSPPRPLRIDTTAPAARLSVRRSGGALVVRVRADDGPRATTSGVRDVRIEWGDGSAAVIGTRTARRGLSHRYAGGGRRRISVTVRDVAGNRTVLDRRVRVGK